MGMRIKLNVWESDFFGRMIGTVHGITPEALPSLDDYRLLQARVSAQDISLQQNLQQLGFRLVEGEITFLLDLAKKTPYQTACQPATTQDLSELKALFGSAFPHSRFRAPWFSAEENQRFYQTWIENAVKGSFDDLCLIKRTQNHQLQGGVSLRLLAENVAQIGLLAVAPEFRRTGVGQQLLKAAVDWAISQQADQLKIVTQLHNLAAIQLYQQAGAKVHAIHYWFYR